MSPGRVMARQKQSASGRAKFEMIARTDRPWRMAQSQEYKQFIDVVNGKYFRRWNQEGYELFVNVVKTGEEKYGDYTLVISVMKHPHQKFGMQAEINEQLLSDTKAYDLIVSSKTDAALKMYKDVCRWNLR